MNSLESRRIEVCAALRSLFTALGVAVVFCQCSSNQTYKDVEYSPEKLATPYGHGLTKSDYPFDDKGNYRKDWVKTKTKERTKTSYPAPPKADTENSTAPETSLAAASVGSNTDAPESSGYYGPADGQVTAASGIPSYDAPASYSVSSGYESGSSSVPSSTSSSVYHKVVSGDTLYGISRKYSVSVDQLKRVNGLSSNNIMKGQSLRIR